MTDFATAAVFVLIVLAPVISASLYKERNEAA